MRGAGPVRPRWIESGADFLQHPVEDLLVVVPKRCGQALPPAPVQPGGFDLVVARPNDNAGMVAQSFHIVDRLSTNVIEKFLICRIQAARKHELLPDHDSHLIAQLIKLVSFVDAAAPDSQHVHVAVVYRLDEKSILIFGDARRKTVGRNPIATLREDWNAIDDEHEALSSFIALSS